VASVNPEFGTTLEKSVNRSLVSAVLLSNLIAIGFATAETRRLNGVLDHLPSTVKQLQSLFLVVVFISVP